MMPCAPYCAGRQLRRTHFDYLLKLGPPLIVFQEVFQTRASHVALVHQDDLAGGLALARHLLGRRPRTIVFVRPMLDWCAVEQREKGLRAGLKSDSRNIELKTVLAPSEGFEDVRGTVEEHLRTRVPGTKSLRRRTHCAERC